MTDRAPEAIQKFVQLVTWSLEVSLPVAFLATSAP